LISFFTEKEKSSLYSLKGQNNSLSQYDFNVVDSKISRYPQLINNLLYLDFKMWLSDDVLLKVDKMTMAHSLEARVPFLDKEFIALCSQIPANLKLRGFTEKYILRQSMKGVVPKEIIKRKKHGFNVPIQDWLNNELKGMVAQLLSPAVIKKQGFYNPAYIEKLLTNYKNNPHYYSRQLWVLLNFELWHKIYIESDVRKINISKFEKELF